MSCPPTLALRSTNCAGVIRPSINAFSPYLASLIGWREQPLENGSPCHTARWCVAIFHEALIGRAPNHSRSPSRWIRPVVDEGDAILGVLQYRPGIRKTGFDDQSVIDARIGIGVPLLHDRRARPADRKRVPDRTVRFDEVLFGHHQRLGLHDQVAVVSGGLQISRQRREAASQHFAVEHARRRSLLVRDTASGTSYEKQFTVPAGLWIAEVPGLGWVVQDRDLILPPVHRAGLLPDDERNRSPLIGRGLRDQG